MIKKAIILAAGMGTRLSPLTRDLPKCMVRVNDTPILRNSLSHLADAGIEHVVMVVGYMDWYIRAAVGSRYNGMDIEYIRSDAFRRTNNMYSLWLAGSCLCDGQGLLLLEGDLFFESGLLEQLLADPHPDCWAADRFGLYRDGCMITAGPDRQIRKIRIIRHPLPHYLPCQHKSAGLLKLGPQTSHALWDCLDFEVRHWHLNLYYDQVLARHLREFSLAVCDIHGCKWMEIDDVHDLEQANALFKEAS